MSVRTVKVTNVSAKATVQDIKEFFSFSGEIQCVDVHPEGEQSQTVYVTFKDSQGAETSVLLSGATIVDQAVVIALAPDHNMPDATSATSPNAPNNKNVEAVVSAVRKAEDVVSSMLAKGFTLSKDALNKAKTFDEQHQLSSTASAKVASVNQTIGLTGKISAGTTIVNEKVKEMDQKFQVSEKTKSAFASAEQTISSAGSAIMNNRYVMTGTTWVTGALSRVVAKSPEGSPKKTTEGNVSAEEKVNDRDIKVLVESTDKVDEPAPATIDPHVVESAKNDPPVVDSTKVDLPMVKSAKNDLTVVESAKTDPPVVESSKDDPPVVESAKDDPPVVESAKTDSPPVVKSAKDDLSVVESTKPDP